MDLEPRLVSVPNRTSVDLVVTLEFLFPGFTLVSTSIHKQRIFTDIRLDKGHAVTLFAVQKEEISARIWVLRTPETLVVEHVPIDVARFQESTEICTGIAAVTQGYDQCAVSTTTHNENNPVFSHWFQDDRSRSLVGALHAIHLLQIPLAILECTPKVIESKEAQSMFQQFSCQTGKVIHQKLLNLHTFWPSRRQR